MSSPPLTRPSSPEHGLHLVVVDHYFGLREHVYDAGDLPVFALGLPLAELAARNNLRVTLLDWSEWLSYEREPGSFLDWMPFPATRPAEQVAVRESRRESLGQGITLQSVPARDPDFGTVLSAGLSPRSYGLLADSDPLFFMSYVLNQHLEALHARDPITAVLVPMFGGLGYVAQLSRATGAGLTDVPFGVVVTDTSKNRQSANAEGLWTRPAMTRRQMEDMSLALGDVAVVFGPRGAEIARAGRNGGALIVAPRVVGAGVAEAILQSAERGGETPVSLNFFIEAPQQGSAGTLAVLDAARLLKSREAALDGPIHCAGTNMTFGPAKPGTFQGYWSGRGWVRAMAEDGFWRWTREPRAPEGQLNIRVYPTRFDPLPQVGEELARGSFVLLSAASAEGLVSAEELPPVVWLGENPDAEMIADRVEELQAMGAVEVDRLRRDLCRAVAGRLVFLDREKELNEFCSGIAELMAGRCEKPRMADAARLLLDRKVTLSDIPRRDVVPTATPPCTLTAVVTCYELGDLVVETVESIWRSTRMPDELILVDDGSAGEATRLAIEQLRTLASARNLPFTLLRQENLGLCDARNAALAAARSSYISFIDGDDLIHPEFYRMALSVLSDNPELGGVAAWAEIFGEGVPDGFWNAPQAELPLLLVENTVIVPCVMPTELVRSLGGYDARQRYNYEDWELAVRLLAAGRPIVTIPRYLQRYRVRADSLLRTMSDVQNQVMREQFLDSHRELCAAFAPEIALQIEHRLFLKAAAAAAFQPASSSWQIRARKAYTKLRRLGARASGEAV